MEKRAAKRCQTGNSNECIADVPHPPHHWQMAPLFSPVAASAYAIIVQAMIRAPSSLFLPHRFLAHGDTLVMFFLSEESKGYLP
jgi:hypothetical protein